MKKYILSKRVWDSTIFFIVLVSFLVSSCTKQMEGINRNTKHLSDEQLQIDGNGGGFLLPGIMRAMFPTTAGALQLTNNNAADAYAGYLQSPTDFLANESTLTYSMPDRWIASIWNMSNTVFNSWLTMRNQGFEDKYNDLYSIALICKAHAGLRYFDIFGPYPYSQFGASANDVPFDRVEDGYDAVWADLTKAIENLQAMVAVDPNAGAIRLAKWDVTSLKGSYPNWIKLANTLRLRMAIRISLVNPDKARSWAEETMKPEAGGYLDESTGTFTITPATINPYWTISESWTDIRIAAEIPTFLKGFNDPRLPLYALPAQDPAANGEIVGIRPSIFITNKDVYVNFSKMNITEDGTIKVVDGAESYFLRAEGALRGWNMGGTPEELYEDGVRASFTINKLSDADSYLQSTGTQIPYVDPKDASKNSAPMTDITVKWDESASFEKKLERIITQKWISMYPEGQEAWSEARRTGYPKLYPPVYSSNPDIPVGPNAYILRITYPATVYNTSGNAVNAAINADLNGHDSAAEPLWWDVRHK